MSSKRRLRRRECEGKRQYGTPGEARRMIAWLSSIGRARPGTHAYRCQFCGWWHIGRGGRGLKGKRIKAWQWNSGV